MVAAIGSEIRTNDVADGINVKASCGDGGGEIERRERAASKDEAMQVRGRRTRCCGAVVAYDFAGRIEAPALNRGTKGAVSTV